MLRYTTMYRRYVCECTSKHVIHLYNLSPILVVADMPYFVYPIIWLYILVWLILTDILGSTYFYPSKRHNALCRLFGWKCLVFLKCILKMESYFLVFLFSQEQRTAENLLDSTVYEKNTKIRFKKNTNICLR